MTCLRSATGLAPAIAATALALAPALLAAGCGDGDARAGGGSLHVAAAASLSAAVGEYAREFERAHGVDVAVRFAGSDELAAQIRQGVRTDVYLSADERLAARLHEEGELERPRRFASNRLVVIAPAGGDVTALADLAADGMRLALGDPEVPVGRYAREAIERLPGLDPRRVLANVRSEEPDVKSVLGKVARGGADGGIVYATDAKAAEAELRVIAVPDSAQPEIGYAGGVVSAARNAEQARRFVDGLLDGAGRRALEAAGFAPPGR